MVGYSHQKRRRKGLGAYVYVVVVVRLLNLHSSRSTWRLLRKKGIDASHVPCRGISSPLTKNRFPLSLVEFSKMRR